MSDNIRKQAEYWGQQQSPDLNFLKQKYKDMQPWQVKARDPQAYKALYEQAAPGPTGIADSNPVTDFLGNMAWAVGEEMTLGASLGIDLYAGGEVRETLGVQEWADNSWAGRLGQIAGQGVGFISGVGLIGKGLGKASGALNLGRKALSKGAGKKLRSETGETLNKIVGDVDDAVMRDFSEELYQTGAVAIKTGQEAAKAFGRTATKVDPFSNFDLQGEISKNFDELLLENIKKNKNLGDNVRQNLLDPANKELRDEIRDNSIKAAQEFRSEDVPRVLAAKWSGVLGDHGAQVAGDMAYEATLLGLHGGLRNLVERGVSAGLDIDDENYGRRSFFSDVMHGMIVGGMLAPTRYIPGGARVEVDLSKGLGGVRSGVLANVKQMGQSVIRKYNGKKATDYTPKQLQTMMRNVWYGSNKNTEFFRGIEGWTPRLVEDVGMLANATNVKVLQNVYNKVSRDLSKNLIPMLRREVARDLFESAPRYVVGSAVMNAQNWYQNYDHITADQFITDAVVGMFYMKRGKVLSGKPPLPKFLTSSDIKGNEIAKMSQAFDVLGYDKTQLDFMGSAWDKVYADHMLGESIIQRGKDTMPDIRNANAILEKDMVPATDYVQMLKDPTLKNFNEQISLEYTQRLSMASDLRAQGREAEARRMELSANDLLAKSDIAQMLVNDLNFGMVDKNVQPMTKDAAIEFINRMSSIELNGKKLTIDNVSAEIQKLRKAAAYKTTSQIQLAMEDYIKNSLDAFGLWDVSMESAGTINIHPSTKDLLLKKLASNEKLGEYSTAIMALHDVLEMASRTGVIRFTDTAMAWKAEGGQKLTAEKLNRIADEYKINTERMHDLVMGTENSGWRDLVTNKRTSEAFMDDHILASTPIWHAIDANMKHLRNDIGLHILTGKGGQGTEQTIALHQEIMNDLFKGKRKIILSEEAGERTLTDKPHLINVLNNLNRSWQLTEGVGKRGVTEIRSSQLEAIHEKLSREVGNVFSDNNAFQAFKNYLDNTYIDNILGGSASYGAKKALSSLIQEGNPLAFTDPVTNKRVIASGEAIRTAILGSEYGIEMQRMNPEFASEVRTMVDRYIKEIERPVKGKGDYLEFSDKITIDQTSQHNPKDWMQSLLSMEALLDGSKVVDISRVVKNVHLLESMNSSFNTAAHFEKLAQVADNKITVEQLRAAMDGLRTNTRQLSYLVTDAMQNGDFLMIRQLVDAQYDIQRAIDRAKQFTAEGKGSIEEVSSTIYKVTMEAINERNRKLSLDSVESVDEFIRRQEEVVTRQDRSGKPVLESQTISESQYKSKYGIDQTSLDLIKGDMVAFSNTAHDLAAEVSSFMNNFPGVKQRPDAMRTVLENLENLGIPADAYMSQIVKPWIETQWTKAKALDDKLNRDTFLTDTAQLLVSAWAQKKVTLGNFENGALRLSTKSVTNWDAGFLGLINSLGIQNKPNSFMIMGEQSIAGNRTVNKLSETMMQEINAKLAAGANIKVERSELFSANERAELEKMLKDMPIVGEGADGRAQFQAFRLDEKQAIILSTSTYPDIVNRWRSKGEGSLFNELSKVVGETAAKNYLEKSLKLNEFKNDQIDTQKFTTETIEGLLLTTRLLKDNAFYLDKLVKGEMTREEVFKALKYLKLSNPRGGITLNKKTVDIMRYFTKEIMPDTPQYKDIKRHFEGQMSRPHRQVTLFDEKGPNENFFNSDAEYRAKVRDQYVNERGFSVEEATKIANELADKLAPEAKSKVDGEQYLSLPEMTALLTSRGADASWFVFDANNNVVGFNTIIKPVVSQSKVNPDGSMSVVINKTAFKYDPTMDAAMKNADGTYFTDSIAFKSASKVNQSKASAESPWVENAIPVQTPTDVTKPWKPQVALDIQNQNTAGSNMRIASVDRANMMLKSISGPHDGTLSMAFGNFLSNPAQDVMNSWLKSTNAVKDLSQHMQDLYQNPFAFKAIAEKLKGFDKETGDITASLTGLEAVLSEGGIPIYEHLRPQIERALVGNYLGSRNFASGNIENGAYNVMTAADGLSLPVRENGMQSRFGGSGIPHAESNKNIRTMLRDPGGTESVSLIFRITESQANALNKAFKAKSEVKTDIFKAGDELIASGDGSVSGTFDGMLNRIYGSNLEGSYGPGRRNAIMDRQISSEIVQDLIGKNYKDIIQEAFELKHSDGADKIQTLGELVRFVDGKPLSAVERQNEKTYFEDYTITDGTGSMAQKHGYQSVRVADVNLRTPKDGINSWVITGIEKLIDRRKGAVSEMNSQDLINPQDADFDLDKSASFFGTPGPILKEIHAASGYHEISSERIWDKALTEVSYEMPQMSSYINELKNLESARPVVVRQHSLTSLMYQYFTSLDGLAQKNLIRPGYETGIHRDKYGVDRVSQSTPGTNVVIDFQAPSNRTKYQIAFRHGGEFVDAIGHMKKVIKHTIDTYGDLTKLNDRNMMEEFWFNDNFGLFKVVETEGFNAGREVGWNNSVAEIAQFKKQIKDGFLNPMNKIFNLGLGVETLSDGTSRKLGFYDYVSTFERARSDMSRTAEFNKELKPFIDNFLGFLGERPGAAGTSNHPLVDGLIKMTEAHNKNFPMRIERGNELGNMLNGAAVDVKSVEVQNAINKYMQNEKNWVRFSSLQWEVNQLENTLNDMRARRQDKTRQYENMEKRKQMLTETLGQVEVIANDKFVRESTPRRRSGQMAEADANYAVYKVRNGDVKSVTRISKGDRFFWNAGDVVVKNPRTFRFTDPIQQKHLRTMHRAFGNLLTGVEKFDVADSRGYVRSKINDIKQEFYNIDTQFSDASVRNNSMYKDIYSTKLEALKTSFNDIMIARGPQYAKQFLHTLLTPRVSNSEMSILGYDNKNESYYSGFRFQSNKSSEQMVMRFMTAAMDGKVSGFNKALAKEWFAEIEQARKIAYLMTHDKSLSGDAFKIGNLDRGLNPSFDVLPRTDAKPKLLDVKANNEQARKTIQSYLTGSYFLDPIELYRLTVGLDKTMNEMPSPQLMGDRVKNLWTDVGKNSNTIEVKEDLGRAVYRMSKVPIENSMNGNREHIRRKTFSEKLWEEMNCNN